MGSVDAIPPFLREKIKQEKAAETLPPFLQKKAEPTTQEQPAASAVGEQVGFGLGAIAAGSVASSQGKTTPSPSVLKPIVQTGGEDLPENKIAIDYNSNDPIASVLLPLQLTRNEILQRNIGAASTGVKKPLIEDLNAISLDSQRIKNINNRISHVANEVFPNANVARDYLQNKINLDVDNTDLDTISSAVNKNNATQVAALDKYKRSRNINTALNAPTLEEGAIQYAMAQSPQIAKQVEALGGVTDQLPDAFAGNLVAQFLYSPEVLDKVKDDPEMVKKWKETQFNLANHYPGFARARVAQLLSQAREDRGMNSGFANTPGKEEMDKLVDDLVGEGKMNLQDKEVYEKQIRPQQGFFRSLGRGLGRVVAPALVNENPIQTPGFVESLGDSYVNTLHGVARSVEDLMENQAGGQPLFDKQKRLNDLIQHDYSAVSMNPKGLWHEITQSTGHITGFMLPMILGSEIGTAAGLGRTASGVLTNGLMFEGQNRDEALKQFPDNPDKQYLYTAIGTGADVALGELLPTKEAAKAARGALTPEITRVINEFTDGTLTAEAAKGSLLKSLRNIGIGNAKIGAVMSGFNIFHNGLDAAFGGRDVSFDQAASDAVNTFKSGLLGGTLLTAAKELGSAQSKVNNRAIVEMARNPEFFRQKIEEGAALDPDLAATKNERLRNLDEAAKVYNEISETDLPPEAKEKYVVTALKQKVWEHKAENTTDDVLKKNYESRAAELSAQKEAILTPAEVKEPPVTEPVTPAEVTTPQPKVAELAQKVMNGEQITAPEDLQFYDDNRTAIEDYVKANRLTNDNYLFEIAKQKYGVSNDGSELAGGGRDIQGVEGKEVDDAVTQRFPDKQSVIEEAQKKYQPPTQAPFGVGDTVADPEGKQFEVLETDPPLFKNIETGEFQQRPAEEFTKVETNAKETQTQTEAVLTSAQDQGAEAPTTAPLTRQQGIANVLQKAQEQRGLPPEQQEQGPEKRLSEFNVGDRVKNTINGEVVTVVEKNGNMVKVKSEITPAGEPAKGDIQELDAAKIPDYTLEGETAKTNPIDSIVSKINADKELTPEEQNIIQENPEEVSKRIKAAQREEKINTFNQNVDKIATTIKSFLSADLPEGTQKLGVGIADLVDAAAAIVKKAHLVGTDIAQAIDDAINHIKANWNSKWGNIPETQIRQALKALTDVPPINQANADRFKNVTPAEATKILDEISAETDQALAEKRQRTLKKLYQSYIKHIEDISGNAKEALRAAGGEDAIMAKDIANKSSGPAGLKIEENEKKIFKGLKEDELRQLGRIIEAKRTILLDRLKDQRGEERLKHKKGKNTQSVNAELYEKNIEDMKAKDPQRYAMLEARAEDYFKSMRELLDAKKANGLVNEEAYQKLLEQSYYSPRLFIQHLDDIDIGSFAGGSKMSVADSGIKKLEGGSEGLLIEDPRLLLALTTEKAYKLMAKNDAAKALYDFSKSTPNNGVVRPRKVIGVSKNGNVQYEDIPAGSDVLHAMVDGNKRDMIVSKDFANDWVATDPAINNGFAEGVQWLTGAAPLRYAATGYNPVFAMANWLRDAGYIFFTQNQYSKILPKFVAQISADMATVAGDVLKRTGRYKDFIKEGGSIELLTHQGRLYQGQGANEGINKVAHALSWIGETSELMTRLALRERSIKNQSAEFEKTNGRAPNADEMKKIQQKGTYDAINQLDFSQGGDYAKALNKFVPYFNASIQATRGLARAVRNNPKEVGIKSAQLMTIAGGLTMYNLAQKGYNDVSDDEKARNWIVMLPFSRVDDRGRTRYTYLKFPKSQEIQGISSMADQIVEYAQTGKKPTRESVDALQNQLPNIPFVTAGTPYREAYRSYVDNYDAYFDEKLWKGKESTPVQQQFTSRTPEAYVIAGKYFHLSPDRLRGAVRNVFPTVEKNPFVTIPSKLFMLSLEATGKEQRNELNKSFLQHLKDVTGGLYGKYVGETFPQKQDRSTFTNRR